MKEAFKFTVIRRQEALNILLACFLPFFFVMWLTGQFFPLKQEQLALWISFITVCSVCGASYWLIRRKALDVLKVELSSESFLVIHSSGQMTHLPLASIVKYRYFVTHGTHNMFITTTTESLKLTTNTLFADTHSTSRFQAMATALQQQLKPVL